MENLTKFEEFKNKKHGSKLNEGVIKIGNDYVVSDIEVPASLVNSYIKKVKDETSKNLREMWSDQDIVHRLVKYCIENHLQIDNLPSSIVLGGEASEEIEVQETQPEAPIQPQDIQAEPVQTQTQSQPEVQAQTAQTAQEIPATETDAAQVQTQVQTQSQEI